MAGNTQRTPKDLDNKSAPAYFNALLDKYEYLQGEQGASYVQVRGETGELVDLATAAKQDLAKGVLDAILAKIIAAPSTAAKQDAAKAVLDTLAGKDFATQTTLAAAKAVLDAISTAVAARATEATLAQIKTALTDGSLKAQITGAFDTIRPMLGATKTATGVASEVFAGDSRKANRRGMAIKIEHPYLRCRIDGLNVTDTTGVAMEPFSQAVIAFDPAVDVPVYIISEAGIVRYGVVEW